MSTNAAREAARHATGQFGEQHKSEPANMSLQMSFDLDMTVEDLDRDTARARASKPVIAWLDAEVTYDGKTMTRDKHLFEHVRPTAVRQKHLGARFGTGWSAVGEDGATRVSAPVAQWLQDEHHLPDETTPDVVREVAVDDLAILAEKRRRAIKADSHGFSETIDRARRRSEEAYDQRFAQAVVRTGIDANTLRRQVEQAHADKNPRLEVAPRVAETGEHYEGLKVAYEVGFPVAAAS